MNPTSCDGCGQPGQVTFGCEASVTLRCAHVLQTEQNGADVAGACVLNAVSRGCAGDLNACEVVVFGSVFEMGVNFYLVIIQAYKVMKNNPV